MKIKDIIARLEKEGDKEAVKAIEAAVKDIKANWLTREEVSKLCPACAEKMQSLGIKRIKASVIEKAIINAAPALPEGWTKESAKQSWKTMTEGAEHKLSKWLSGFAGYKPE